MIRIPNTATQVFGLCAGAFALALLAAFLLGSFENRDDEIARLTQEATIECQKLHGSLQQVKAPQPRLRYDSGAGHVFVAMGYKYDEMAAVHQYVIDIFRKEDPANFQRWEAHLIDHSLDCDMNGSLNELCVLALWHHGSYSVVVPDISMPALASLCQVLPRWGWYWPYRAPQMPERVADAVRYPGRTALMCIRAWYHHHTVPEWFFYERHWQHWEITMITAEAPFRELETAMEFDAETWDRSPWRHRPQLERDLLGYAPGNE